MSTYFKSTKNAIFQYTSCTVVCRLLWQVCTWMPYLLPLPVHLHIPWGSWPGVLACSTLNRYYIKNIRCEASPAIEKLGGLWPATSSTLCVQKTSTLRAIDTLRLPGRSIYPTSPRHSLLKPRHYILEPAELVFLLCLTEFSTVYYILFDTMISYTLIVFNNVYVHLISFSK